ncbi:MAG: HEAT repeat domain-containing protein [Spirochaeta sp.]|nr:HEAT repeat domain-containing protein [Spirochaeta sp.]
MGKLVAISVSLLIILGSTALWAQEQASDEVSGRTIEELYLEQAIDQQIIRGQARSNTREAKFLAIQGVRAMVQRGEISPDNAEMIRVVEGLASEGVGRQVRTSGAVSNNFPDVRREAVGLLGDIGGPIAQRALIRVVQDDPEPMVLAEAVYGLGSIGSNEDNEVTANIVAVLRGQNAREMPDNNLAFASLLALEKIATASGGITDPTVVDALLDVATGNYVREVRLKAIDVIYNLRGA